MAPEHCDNDATLSHVFSFLRCIVSDIDTFVSTFWVYGFLNYYHVFLCFRAHQVHLDIWRQGQRTTIYFGTIPQKHKEKGRHPMLGKPNKLEFTTFNKIRTWNCIYLQSHNFLIRISLGYAAKVSAAIRNLEKLRCSVSISFRRQPT